MLDPDHSSATNTELCLFQEDMEEDDLRSYFGQFGTITDLVRMTDKATGKRRRNA